MRARPVVEGRTYMFTRRCSERRFFLRPDALTNNAFWYCLGWAAETHGIVLHAAVAMSNHVHLVATDHRGNYPNFLRDFHGLLARVVNAARGRWEHFWDASQASVVLLDDEEAQIEKLTYVLANPVGLVAKATDWPGATAFPHIVRGEGVVARRPEHFFRDQKQGGAMPETVTVTFKPLPAFVDSAPEDYVRTVRARVVEVERAAAEQRRALDTTVLGPDDILQQRWSDHPETREPRRRLSPAVANHDKGRRLERLAENRLFRALYRAAFEAFRSGAKALFPFGTWLMRFRAAIQVCDTA